MAIGRTFKESLPESPALPGDRCLTASRSGFSTCQRDIGRGPDRQGAAAAARTKLRVPNWDRLWYVGDALRSGMTVEEIHRTSPRSIPGSCTTSARSSRWKDELKRHRSAAAASWRGVPNLLREAKQFGFSDKTPGAALGNDRRRGPRTAASAWTSARSSSGSIPVRAEFVAYTPVPLLDLRRGVRGRADRPQEDHDPRRRSEPDRPGDRIRLLLRARGLCPGEDGYRDHHGQLQPGNRLHRLRHLGPALLRAADPGRCAGNRRH